MLKSTADPRCIPCLFMRGGTSRGAFFLESDLPPDQELRDRVILAVYGSPDPRQINGIGGGDALTSKVAVVGPSERDDADVNYTFGQVSITDPQVFWVGNCGNMLAAVGPFAIYTGLVEPTEPVTRVRIFNTNTSKVITAEVPVSGTSVVEEGDTAIAGVPGTGAPIALDFGDCGGTLTHAVLPTGRPTDNIELEDGTRIDLSIVDAATPFIFVRAADVGMSGTELPAEIEARESLLRRLEMIRGEVAKIIGLVGEGQNPTEVSPSIPRISVVSSPQDYSATDGCTVAAAEVNFVARQMAMQRPHKTYAVTGTLCTSVAAKIEGTIAHEAAEGLGEDRRVNLGHPGGIITAEVEVEQEGNISIQRASILRTARLVMDGHVRVPESVYGGHFATTLEVER